MSDKYTEDSAVSKLRAHGIEVKGSQITLKRCGIGLWGAIDYLCNHCKYHFLKEEKKDGKK